MIFLKSKALTDKSFDNISNISRKENETVSTLTA